MTRKIGSRNLTANLSNDKGTRIVINHYQGVFELTKEEIDELYEMVD